MRNEFSFYSIIEKAEETKDGRWIVTAIASDNQVDAQDDRMDVSALDQMSKQLQGGIPLVPIHPFPFAFGKSIDGSVMHKANGDVQLYVTLELDKAWPESAALMKEIASGNPLTQLSIGGMIPPDDPNAIAWERNGMNTVRVVKSIDLNHIATTRPNKAANSRTKFISSIMKSLDIDGIEVLEKTWDGSKSRFTTEQLVRAVPSAIAAWARKKAKEEGKEEIPKEWLHLPFKEPSGTINLNGVRNALARLPQVQGVPSDVLANAKAELEGILHRHTAKEMVDKMYTGASDTKLPQHIQDKPEHARKIFVAAFNNVYHNCDMKDKACESKAFAVATAAMNKYMEEHNKSVDNDGNLLENKEVSEKSQGNIMSKETNKEEIKEEVKTEASAEAKPVEKDEKEASSLNLFKSAMLTLLGLDKPEVKAVAKDEPANVATEKKTEAAPVVEEVDIPADVVATVNSLVEALAPLSKSGKCSKPNVQKALELSKTLCNSLQPVEKKEDNTNKIADKFLLGVESLNKALADMAEVSKKTQELAKSVSDKVDSYNEKTNTLLKATDENKAKAAELVEKATKDADERQSALEKRISEIEKIEGVSGSEGAETGTPSKNSTNGIFTPVLRAAFTKRR